MPLDPSIYSQIQTPNQNQGSPIDQARNILSLGQMGMQQAQMGYEMRQNAAIRNAYARNTDPQSGQLDRGSFLSELGQTAPMAASQFQNQFVAQDKAKAEAQTAQMQAAHATVSATLPAMQYLYSLPDNEAAKAYPGVMNQLQAQGIPTNNAPQSWDRGWAQQGIQIGMRTKEGLENAMLASNVGKAPAELASTVYGSRSPNAEISSQYDKQAQPVRSSQLAMNQMIDNYKNPSPQGDASLILNAYKIKFPNAPDVNSLKELSESQAAPDMFKQMANKAISGGVDQPTRDNLMRDATSTYRANVNSLRGYQQKYFNKAQAQGIPGAGDIVSEPAIDQTYANAMDLQKQIGPYVPPSGRGGIVGALSSVASKVAGIGNNTAQANPMIKPGTVSKGYVFMGGDPSKPSSWKRQ